MAASTVSKVELGFVEKSPKWRLISQFFPSKVGGKPAWLNLKDIPSSNELACPVCSKLMAFLLQIYCPPAHSEDDELAPPESRLSCFHRSVYVFCCKEPSCHQKTNAERHAHPFKVLRCQLERRNDFYSFEPPDEDSAVAEDNVISPKKFGVEVCDVCGCNAGNKKCGKCNKTSYCCRDHQVMDWKMGHKAKCGKDLGSDAAGGPEENKFLFPEFELVTEPEIVENTGDEKEESVHKDSTDNDLAEIATELDQHSTLSSEDLDRMARKETEDDIQFMAFKKRIAQDSDQVLRYEKGGVPLYVSACDQPKDEDIKCCTCGAPRQFEFQIMPQLLTHLKVDSVHESIDWGTLLVYTCSKSCTDGSAYHPEYLWKQDYHNSSIA